MKKIIYSLVFLLTLHHAYGQRNCPTIFDPETVKRTDPERYQRFMQLEKFTAEYKERIKSGQPDARLINANSTIIIPVVVHVLHNGESVGVGNNISDAQVNSQITILNEDFRRLNADAANTPAAFTGVAADPNIEFRLACSDPSGNATTGIHRVQTSQTSFTVVESSGVINETATRVKYTSQGGTDAWATDRYLNIWVCNLANPVLGYAQFPADFATKPNTDGVVIRNTACGNVGSAAFPFDEGRTATHEVGHWLNLLHIWGSGSTCGDSDNCNDTPNQLTATYNCPSFPTTDACTGGPNGIMFMNYMDYTDDGCMNIFTADQTTRMRAVFMTGGVRASFIDNYFRLNSLASVICGVTNITAVNPSCIPITWSVGGVATLSSSGNTATITPTGMGSISVYATAGGYTDSKSTWRGVPYATFSFEGYPYPLPECYEPWGIYEMRAVLVTGSNFTGYEWGYRMPPSSVETISPYNSPYYTFIPEQAGNYEIFVRPINSCGTGAESVMEVTVSNFCFGWKSITTYPNPAKNEIVVSTGIEKGNVKGLKSEPVQIDIVDLVSGRLIRTWKFSGEQATYRLNIQSIQKGNYILRITKGNYKKGKVIRIEE